MVRFSYGKHSRQEWLASFHVSLRTKGIRWKEVMHMTAYETVMVIFGALSLFISISGLLIALFTLLDMRYKSKKK